MCLTGLLLDPEVRTSSLLSFPTLSRVSRGVENPFSLHSRTPSFGSSRTRVSLGSGSLRRGTTLRSVYDYVEKTFSLPQSSHTRTSSLATELTRVPPSSSASHDENQKSTSPSPMTNSGVTDSHLDAVVSLPFQLDLQVARSKITRNIPYLRQGWGRIDSLAVIGFWVSFALATAGLERGTQHIGIFRAFSVLRTARLLGITDRTAVSDMPSRLCSYIAQTVLSDNHAFPQVCPSFVGECDILCHFCYGVVRVRLQSYHMTGH